MPCFFLGGEGFQRLLTEPADFFEEAFIMFSPAESRWSEAGTSSVLIDGWSHGRKKQVNSILVPPGAHSARRTSGLLKQEWTHSRQASRNGSHFQLGKFCQTRLGLRSTQVIKMYFLWSERKTVFRCSPGCTCQIWEMLKKHPLSLSVCVRACLCVSLMRTMAYIWVCQIFFVSPSLHIWIIFKGTVFSIRSWQSCSLCSPVKPCTICVQRPAQHSARSDATTIRAVETENLKFADNQNVPRTKTHISSELFNLQLCAVTLVCSGVLVL